MCSLAQNIGPTETTPQALQKIRAEVESLVPAYKKRIADKGLNADEIIFSVDTFRISRIVDRRMDVDYSTTGMNSTVDEMTDAYDKLLNRYYNKLLKALNPKDKKSAHQCPKSLVSFS